MRLSFTGGEVGWTTKTSVPRTFSFTFTKTSPSEKREISASLTGRERYWAISSASGRFALPEKSFRSYLIAGLARSWLGREDSNLRIRDPKSRALPLGHAPSFASPQGSRVIRIAGPRIARTAQHAQEPRATRARICRAWSNERATPNTVSPLPDIAAPSAPAARSAASICATCLYAVAATRSSALKRLAPTRAGSRLRSAATIWRTWLPSEYIAGVTPP